MAAKALPADFSLICKQGALPTLYDHPCCAQMLIFAFMLETLLRLCQLPSLPNYNMSRDARRPVFGVSDKGLTQINLYSHRSRLEA